jgi:hypothetical protein
MMDLDELKAKWGELDRKLDVDIRLNRELLTTAKLQGAQSSIRRLAVYLGLEAGLWLLIILALGNFIYEHISRPHFAVSAAVLDLYSIAMLQSLIRQIAVAMRIDYGKPIATIQKEIGALRVLHLRTIQWGVLAGLVAWVPFLIVVFKAAFGVNIYESAWVWSCVGLGLAMIPLAIWVSKKFADRMERSPMIQGIMRSLAGYNLNAANDFLARLSEFAEEKRAS